MERRVHGGSAVDGEPSCSKQPPKISPPQPLFLEAQQRGLQTRPRFVRTHMFANEMMTQLHILEFSMNVLLVSHFISSTSTVAFACKI